jgi:16S rRNA (adenine1518-N6/adenine1519-N6)-dimethyltransferase
MTQTDDASAASGQLRLLGAADVRRLADVCGIRPSKQRGQNFVTDANTVRRIVRMADLRADDVVLEIGPGLGSLTLALLEAAQSVVAIEIDDVLSDQLPHTIAEFAPGRGKDFRLLRDDALRVGAVSDPQPTVLVANLPYNVSVPVLLHALEHFSSLRTALVMVQLEVAERLAAGPGSRIYGVPSVKAAWYADVRLAGKVGRNVFWPVPNVDSALVRLDRREPPEADRRKVFAVIDAAFAQRRKTLRTALAGLAGSPTAAENALVSSGIDPKTRGEQLTIDDFVRLARSSEL